MRQTLDETYHLIDTTLDMVIIWSGDILLDAADDDFPRQAARLDFVGLRWINGNDCGGKHMKAHPVLVDLQKLREIVAGLDLGQDKRWNEYIEARWLNYIEWWDSRANKAKRNYHALRMAVVIGGALIPALVGLRELDVWGGRSWIFAVGSIVASLVVAICAGLESLFGFGDIWRQKRNAAEIIKSEGFCFIQLCGTYGSYTSHQDALKPFAENVEQLIRGEIKEYILAIGPKLPDKPPPL